MKKLFLSLLAALAGLPAMAQIETAEPVRQSVVVGRYVEQGDAARVSEVELVPYKKWGFGVDLGFSYRIARAPEGMSDYVRDLRKGYYFGADLYGAIARGIGLGVRYTGHRYGDFLNNSHKVRTDYFAPSFLFQRPDRPFYFGYSLGYLSYFEELSGWNNSGSIKKGGLGATLDLGYEFDPTQKTSLAIELSYTAGRVDLDMTDRNGDKLIESLGAIDIGLSVRF